MRFNGIEIFKLKGNYVLLTIGLPLFFSFGISNCIAQTTFSTTNFLQTASTERVLIYEDKAINFLKNTPYDLPALEELEFRTETDEFEWGRQEYLMRVRLNSEKEKHFHNKFHQSNIEVAEKERIILLQESLLNRYRILLKYFDLQQEISFERERKLVLEDELTVMRKMVQLSTDFDLTDLIDTEDDLHKMERDLLEMEGELGQLNVYFQNILNLNNQIEIDTTNLISIEKIRSLMNDFSDSINYHPEIDFRVARLEQAMAEYELEIAEEFQFLDYLQVKYSGRNDLDFGRELSIGLGIKIPLKKANQNNLNELKLEKIQNKNRLEALQFDLNQEIQEKRNSLNFRLQQYDLATKQFADSQLSYSIENFQELANERPLTLLKIKESQIRRQKAIINLENAIRESFLEFVELTGNLLSNPTRNWLSEDLEVFEF